MSHGPDPPGLADSGDIARTSVRGAAWMLGSTAVQGAVGVAASIILARLLGPKVYGGYFAAAAIIEISGVVTSWGFGIVLVQQTGSDRGTDAEWIGTALSLSLIIGAGYVGLMWLAAGVATHWVSATVAALLPWLAVRQVVQMAASCYAGPLQRRLRFRLLAMSSAVSAAVCEAMAVGVAVAGGGVWALVTRDLGVIVVQLVILAAFGGLGLRLAWNRTHARTMLLTGGGVIVIRGAEILQSRLDRLVIAIRAGDVATGLYGEAATLSGDSERAVGPVLGQVALGTYARLRGDGAKLGQAFQLVQAQLVRLACLLALVSLVAPLNFLSLLYGERWLAAAPILQAFAVFALCLPMYEHARYLLYAVGKVRDVLRVKMTQAVIFVPLLITGFVLGGVIGAAVAVDLATLVGLAGLSISVWSALGVPSARSATAFIPVAVASAVAACVGLVWTHDAGVGGTTAALRLSLVCLSYVGALLLTDRGATIRDTKVLLNMLLPAIGRKSGEAT